MSRRVSRGPHPECDAHTSQRCQPYVYENTSGTEPLVVLRYFGPEVNPDAPQIQYKGNVKL